MIIRAYELNRWDLFKKQGTVYMVLRITETDICYTRYDELWETYRGVEGIIGKKSQERVQYIGVKPKKKLTKPIKEVYESSI